MLEHSKNKKLFRSKINCVWIFKKFEIIFLCKINHFNLLFSRSVEIKNVEMKMKVLTFPKKSSFCQLHLVL